MTILGSAIKSLSTQNYKNNQPIPVHFFKWGILLTNNTKSEDNMTTTTKIIGIALIGLTE